EDQTVQLEPPSRAAREPKVIGRQVVCVLRSVGAERLRDILVGIFWRQRLPPNKRSLSAVGRRLRSRQKALECRSLGQPVASAQCQRRSAADKKLTAANEQSRFHHGQTSSAANRRSSVVSRR